MSRELSVDLSNYAFKVRDDFIVFKSEYNKAQILHIHISGTVICFCFFRVMGRSVEFNDEFEFWAIKIGDIWTYAVLSSESIAELIFLDIFPD